MIPDTNDDGLLPEGLHWATWPELEERFATTAWRRTLIGGARRAAKNLKAAGCRTLYLDGSYVTDKDRPRILMAAGTRSEFRDSRWTQYCFPSETERAAQKAKYHGELFPASAVADQHGTTYLDFFQRDKQTGKPKGIVAIDLESFP